MAVNFKLLVRELLLLPRQT